MRALWTAATGMQAQQLTLDVVANNPYHGSQEHFDGASNKDPDRACRTVADGVNQVLGHGDGFGRTGKADLRLLHQGYRTTKLLSLLHVLDCEVDLVVRAKSA